MEPGLDRRALLKLGAHGAFGLAAAPRVAIRQRVPYGFHATWVPTHEE